jgi:hypothetical protein
MSSKQLDIWLSFEDLRASGIINSWEMLRRWQQKLGFPRGRLIGPNSRRWSKLHDIDPWLAARPVEDEHLIEIMRERAAHSVASPRHISKRKKKKPPST